MEKLKLFTSPLLICFFAAIIVLHISSAIIKKVLKNKHQRVTFIISVVTMLLHLMMFVGYICIRVVGKSEPVTAEELFFVLVISSTVALVTSNVKGSGEE